MNLLLAVFLGALFGFALYMVGASKPDRILSMLRLQDLTLMKIIVFGIGFSSVLLGITIGLGFFPLSHISIKATNAGVLLGGFIFGLGFGSVGTCPGTCVAATGTAGVRKALAAVVGGLVGAFAFSMTYQWWKQTGLFQAWNLGKVTLFSISDSYDSVLTIGYPGLIVVGLVFMAAAYLIPMKGRKKY